MIYSLLEYQTEAAAREVLELFASCGLERLKVEGYVVGTITSYGDESMDSEVQVDFSRLQGRGWRIRYDWTDPVAQWHWLSALSAAGQVAKMSLSASAAEKTQMMRDTIAEHLPTPADLSSMASVQVGPLFRDLSPRVIQERAALEQRKLAAREMLLRTDVSGKKMMGTRMIEDLLRDPATRPIAEAVQRGELTQDDVRARAAK